MPFYYSFSSCPRPVSLQTPRGRALAKAARLASLERGAPANPSQWARVLENYVYLKRGPTPRYRPWRGQRMLENHSCFVREGGWQYNLSVNPAVVHPRSPFRLDYQSVFSVWHESVGLIVSGSQDKKRPWHNSFYAKGPGALGILYGGQIGNLCEPKYLEALYSSNARGRIEVVPRADTLELTVN